MQRDSATQDLRDLVIDQVDDARDILDLARQLEQFLPIESFEQLVKASGGKQLRFRDVDFDVISLAGFLPSIVFPVHDTKGLVERLGELVRAVPPGLGVDLESELGNRRIHRARRELAPGVSWQSKNAVAGVGQSGPSGPLRDQPPVGTSVPTDPTSSGAE